MMLQYYFNGLKKITMPFNICQALPLQCRYYVLSFKEEVTEGPVWLDNVPQIINPILYLDLKLRDIFKQSSPLFFTPFSLLSNYFRGGTLKTIVINGKNPYDFRKLSLDC
jgi:hypothetical protein